MGYNSAEAESGETRGFGKSADHEEVGEFSGAWNYGETGEFGVGFVDDHGGVRGGSHDGANGLSGNQCARRIVGVGDEEHAWFLL